MLIFLFYQRENSASFPRSLSNKHHSCLQRVALTTGFCPRSSATTRRNVSTRPCSMVAEQCTSATCSKSPTTTRSTSCSTLPGGYRNCICPQMKSSCWKQLPFCLAVRTKNSLSAAWCLRNAVNGKLHVAWSSWHVVQWKLVLQIKSHDSQDKHSMFVTRAHSKHIHSGFHTRFDTILEGFGNPGTSITTCYSAAELVNLPKGEWTYTLCRIFMIFRP